ncbi:MAG: hypothetical protein WDN03_01000 [Rhizomicrobium sp.]
MALASAAMRDSPLDYLDLLIVTAIADANNRPALEGRRGAAPAGVSRNGVSRKLHVPLETVRRRVAALIGRNILSDREDGLVFLPANKEGIGSNAELDALNLDLLRQLFAALRAHGVPLD